MNLDRPLIVLDVESDGPGDPDPALDRVIQVGLCILKPSGERKTITRDIHPGPNYMPLRRTEIHGITDEMLTRAPIFRNVAVSLLEILHGCDIATYNGNKYDIPLLVEEFLRASAEKEKAKKPPCKWDYQKHRHIDVARLWSKMEGRKLEDAIDRFVGVRPSGELHNAGVDSSATADVLFGMLQTFNQAPQDVGGLAELTASTKMINGQELPCIDPSGSLVRGPNGEALFTAKRVRGKAIEEDTGFADWMLRSDFPEATKEALRSELFRVECEQSARAPGSSKPY